MSHQAQKVATKLLAEGHYAQCYRCCGNPATDSWLTVMHPERLPAAALQQAIAKHAAGVEARHARMEAALPLIATLSRTLDATHMAEAMECHGGRINPGKAGLAPVTLGSHAVRVTRCVPWNDEQVRIECDCCAGGAQHEGVVTVFRAIDAATQRAGLWSFEEFAHDRQWIVDVEAEVVRVMERAAVKHSGYEWVKRNAQQNP